MEPIEIKNRRRRPIEERSPEKRKMALDLFEDLQRSEAEETQALLAEPGFLEDYHQAKEDIRTGQAIPWEEIKQDVQH